MSAILRFAGAGGNPAVESRVLFARRCAQMSHLGIVQERFPSPAFAPVPGPLVMKRDEEQQ